MSVYYVTSESVTRGHPDKFCDQVSDAILDEVLAHDPEAHVAIETMATDGHIIVAGEVKSTYHPDYAALVNQVIKRVKYDPRDLSSTGKALELDIYLHGQSPDIDQGVSKDNEIGAGDQGIMYGYATSRDETGELMPLPYVLACYLTHMLEDKEFRETNGLGSDGKSQVTVAYDEQTHEPQYVDTVVVSVQYHDDDSGNRWEYIRDVVTKRIKDTLGEGYITETTKIYVNPTGAFTMGGPACDTGLTGRKLAVDTYGGVAHHGAGAFSGKDPTKVDRSGAYAARHVAKTIVASGITPVCEVGISYAIGKAKPVHLRVDTQGCISPDRERLLELIVADVFDLTPAGIISELSLRSTKYLPTASGGHFMSTEYPWEDVSKAELIKDIYQHN